VNMQINDERLVLSDADLRLRPARLPEDCELAEAWYSDPEVMRFSEGDENSRYDAAMVEKMYRCLAGQGELYIIELRRGEMWLPIGDVTLAPDTIPIVIGVAECRSRGYGKRVLKLVVERARSLGWSELRVKNVYTFNVRSRRLYASLGFVQDGDIFYEEDLPCWRFVKQL
jgi:RimJ/RimL family protein N-acetyltransferase